ncbi:MAG: hypothetical protein JWM10_346 [Myxococcaceae bacterium]|nr:hypothetical protein [Myxococcaceae bacterium]
MTIVVVDDNPSAERILTALLKQSGVEADRPRTREATAGAVGARGHYGGLGAIGARWVLGACVLLGCARPGRPVVTATPAVAATPAVRRAAPPNTVCAAPPRDPPQHGACTPSAWQRVTPPAPRVERERSVALSGGATLWIGRHLDREEQDGTARVVCEALGEGPEVAVAGDTILAWGRCGDGTWCLWRSTDGGRHCERAGGDLFRWWTTAEPVEQLPWVAASSRAVVAWSRHGQGELWISTDAGQSWREGPRPHGLVEAVVPTESGDLVALSRGAGGPEVQRLASPAAGTWERVPVAPPLQGRLTAGTTPDGAVYVADSLGITRLPPQGAPERRVYEMAESVTGGPADFEGSWAGQGRFVGVFETREPFMELTMSGLHPWASAPRALPWVRFYPDGRGGLYGISRDVQLHQSPDGAWRDLRGTVLGSDPMTAVAARGPRVAVAGRFGAVAWSLDGGACWTSARLPAAAGQPYRMTVDDEGNLLVLGTGALVRLSLPDARDETISLPAGWTTDPAEGWDGGLPGTPTVFLGTRRGAILLMSRSLWERGVDGAWRERFGCTDPRSSALCFEGRDAHTAMSDDGGIWLLDSRSALWRRRADDGTFARVSNIALQELSVMGATPGGVLTLASRYELARSRDGGLHVELAAITPVVYRDSITAGVVATDEGLLLMRQSPRSGFRRDDELPITASVFEEGGRLRTVSGVFTTWARDEDVLYGGTGGTLWRASIRALLRPPQGNECNND